jgi:hypothetical protein
MSRHPGLNQYIFDVVNGVILWLREGTACAMHVVITDNVCLLCILCTVHAQVSYLEDLVRFRLAVSHQD